MKNIINISSTTFVSLLIFVSLTDVFGYTRNLADLTISNPHEQLEYNYKECLSMNKIVYEDRCWDLLIKGPCDEGQWLVLDKVSDEMQLQESHLLRAKCKRRRCSESDVYWPRDGFCYDKETAGRDRLCPSANTVLTIDVYGNGFCKCREDINVLYVRVFGFTNDDHDSQPCYPVYSKGPCPKDHVITPYRNKYGVCAADDCAEERRLTDSSSPMSQRSGSQVQRGQPISLARWTDGQCYELGTQGPCTGHQDFTVLNPMKRPGCIALLKELSMLPETIDRLECETDHWGNCEEGVEVSTTPNELKDALLKNAKRYSQKMQITRAHPSEVRRHRQ